ncbi:MerR family transcriptional regulator [Rhodovastum sp. RN2-1]|uniref:MerR family transcriptional regulator n=2 Tax=Limobrevibacterium gyesilva TaxID=2991712 RepID=A0AA42CGK8_9PROT|nr:MerR family transcriptional regulator [Limobrevibacterium gyesilva]MCW3473945.1 MerR family transcriptional regulator [Limobrevibacterium gyesilva]
MSGSDPDAGTEHGDAGRARLKKAPNAFRTISEVADELHIPQHVLRFWETKFPQVKPLKRGGGRRYYRPDDILLLRRISDLLYIQGYTIKGVQRLLREGGGKLSDDIPPATPDEQAEAEAERGGPGALDVEPQLPMPGLTPPHPASPQPPHVAQPAPAPAPAVSPGEAEAADSEAARLRAVLTATLHELEALRALLPRSA